VDTGSHVAFALGSRLLASSAAPPSRASIRAILPVQPGPEFLAEIDRTRYLSLAVPVAADAAAPAVALLQRSYDGALAPLFSLRRRIIVIGLGSLGVALGLALAIAQRIDKPLQTLVAGTKQIMAGNLSHRVPEQRKDELGFLARSFNRMSAELEQRERTLTALNAELEGRVKARTADLEASYRQLEAAQVQLVQSEKMASLGVLVAGVAHEINNPVTFVANNVEPMNERLTELRDAAKAHPEIGLDEPLRDMGEIVDLIREGAVRTAAIVNDLRTFSRLSDSRPAFFDLNENLEVCLRLLRPRWAERISIERDLGDLPRVEGVVGHLNQVLMNLLANACDAIEERGHIWITTRREGDSVRFSVRDDGIGMSAETLAHVFEPFFTTKPQGKGTGLGLAITHGIVASHGGSIRVESEPGRGSEVIVTLPLRCVTLRVGRGAA
jgi:signal transduction histidine kinase